ncbi:hypothetical protein Hte_004476 [Hypoxylon texense]
MASTRQKAFKILDRFQEMVYGDLSRRFPVSNKDIIEIHDEELAFGCGLTVTLIPGDSIMPLQNFRAITAEQEGRVVRKLDIWVLVEAGYTPFCAQHWHLDLDHRRLTWQLSLWNSLQQYLTDFTAW